MGSSKSQEYSSLVLKLEPNQFFELEDRGEFKLWEDRVSSRCYMVFTLKHQQAFTQQNLQIYQFRRLNRAFLAGIYGIYTQEKSICSQSPRTLLMVEYLPYSLLDFHQKLSMRDGLIVLKAVFAGYRIMSYIFGALLCQEDTVYFTQGGVPKVWSNNQLDCNQPSSRMLRTGQSQNVEIKHLFENLDINSKRIQSIKSIIRAVSNSVKGGFYNDFLKRLSAVKSYQEGEEIIQQYCRNNSIFLDDWIMLTKPNQQKIPLIGSQGFLERVASNSLHHNQFNKALNIRNKNIEEQRANQSQVKVFGMNIQKANEQHQIKPVNVRIQYRNAQAKDVLPIEQVVTQTLIKPIQHSHPNYYYQPEQFPIKSEIAPQPQENTNSKPFSSQIEQLRKMQQASQRGEVQSQFRSSHSSQQYPGQVFQLNVHQVMSNSNPSIPIHDKTIEMQMAQSKQVDEHIPYVDSWKEAPQFASNKNSKQSSENYKSQERDKVRMLDLSKTGKVQQKQYESSISSMFDGDMIAKENNKHNYTPSIQKQFLLKKVKFAQDYSQTNRSHEQQQKKYTFGKIESSRMMDNQIKFREGSSGKRKKKINEDESLNDKYSKYVTNRSGNNKKEKVQVQQTKAKKEGKRLFQQFRRVLQH